MTSEKFQVSSETLAINITGNQPKCQRSTFQNNALHLWRFWNFKWKILLFYKTILVSNTSESENFFNNLTLIGTVGREEGQAKLHFPEDTIRGGTKSFCNVKKKKQKTENIVLIIKNWNIFTIPLRKGPELFWVF